MYVYLYIDISHTVRIVTHTLAGETCPTAQKD